MNISITINYNSERPTVNGRELHNKLGIGIKYPDWFKRMCEYGFVEGKDYETCFSNLGSEMHGGQNKLNHELTISMAKELCMIQRSDIGRQFRQYFIQVEEQWNSPEAVMVRALQFVNKQLLSLEKQNAFLQESVALKNQQISEMKPKASYFDIVISCKNVISTGVIAKDYGKSAQWMNNKLHELGIQYKQGKVWLLYQKHAEYRYTNTKTHWYKNSRGEDCSNVHTYWTQKGRMFIYESLKKEGILPLIEGGENNVKIN